MAVTLKERLDSIVAAVDRIQKAPEPAVNAAFSDPDNMGELAEVDDILWGLVRVIEEGD